MIDLNELFPRLREVYTEKGVEEFYEAAELIEKMAANLTDKEIFRFIWIMDANYSEVYSMLYRCAMESDRQ